MHSSRFTQRFFVTLCICSLFFLLSCKKNEWHKSATLTINKTEFKIDYKLTYEKGKYPALLTIRDNKGNVVWEQYWEITSDDMNGFPYYLETNDQTSEQTSNETNDQPNDHIHKTKDAVDQWVNAFFTDRNLGFGSEYEIVQNYDLHDDERLKDHCKELNISLTDLKDKLRREKHIILWYRADWYEDVMVIVYLPEYNKFIDIRRGEPDFSK